MSTKSIKLIEDETKAYNKIKYLAHYDSDTGENTYPEYGVKLKIWLDNLRKKHKLKPDESFYFI